MFKTDLSNQVRQTPLPAKQCLLPLFEAVMNSIQAIGDRKAIEPNHPGGVTIDVERQAALLDDKSTPAPILSFTIIDNGIGLDDDNWDSFNTAFSPHRVEQGGKGLGRIIWLKAFEAVDIDSVFLDGETPWRRSFTFDFNHDGETLPVEAPGAEAGTRVQLRGFREFYSREAAFDIPALAERLVEHFLLFFVRGTAPQITLRDQYETIDLTRFFKEHYAAKSTLHAFEVGENQFRATGFRLASRRVTAHQMIFAAHNRAVRKEKLARYIPNLASRLGAGAEGFFYQVVVEGAYLDETVNRERTAFDIQSAEEMSETGLFGAEVSLKDIRDRVLLAVRDDLAEHLQSLDAEKLHRIDTFIQEEAPHYRILLKRRDRVIEKIAPDATRSQIDAVMHAELRDLELDMKAQGQRVLLEAEHIDDYEAYRARLSQFIEQYNELGIASLAQHVMHRKIIIDLFEKALQKNAEGDRYPLESMVHKIIFPMQATSDDILFSQHNLWLVDERLAYHSHVSSDRRLASTPLSGSGAALRPDLVIFDQKGVFAEDAAPLTSVVLVEFKRPGRIAYSGEDPLEQLFKLSEEIKAGRHQDERGRAVRVSNKQVPVFAYLICDLPPQLRTLIKGKDAQEMADGMGYYGYNRNYGVYYEILEYEKVLSDAKKRNRSFFDKLMLA